MLIRPLWQTGDSQALAVSAAGGLHVRELPVMPIPGGWGPREAATVGPLVAVVTLQPAEPALWAALELAGTLDSGASPVEGLATVWRPEDTQTQTGAGLYLRAELPAVPALLLRVRLTVPQLASNTDLIVSWQIGAIPLIFAAGVPEWGER